MTFFRTWRSTTAGLALAFGGGLFAAGTLHLPPTSEAQSQAPAQTTAAKPVPPSVQGLQALSESFASVAEQVKPSVVYIKSGKKAGSFIGLSPSEDSTGQRWQLGPVDKHGSPRLRFWCVEAAWRLLKFQPTYRGVVWAREKLRDANTHRAKQISVALARRFFVDWWRVRTGRVTAAELGFVFKPAT